MQVNFLKYVQVFKNIYFAKKYVVTVYYDANKITKTILLI